MAPQPPSPIPPRDSNSTLVNDQHTDLPDDNLSTSDDGAITLTKSRIQRLGRERPAVLTSKFMEFFYVLTIVVSMMISEYFISGFNVTLPPIAEALHISESQKTWPAAVPNLTTAAFLLPFARLCDRFGGRVVFLGGHVWVAIWSIVCGFSQNSIMLIMCRALQGVGFSAFLPAGLALLGHTYRPGPRKNLIYGIFGAFSVLGFYFGIIIGAVAEQWLTWRWYFWIGAILSVAVVASGFVTIPKTLGDSDKNTKMDWWGLGTIVPGLILVVFAFIDGGSAPQGWKTPYIYVTLIIGILFLLAAVYIEGWLASAPLLPPDLFKPKYMRRLVLGLFCWYGVFGLFLFYATYQMEIILHTTSLQTAAWCSPLAVGGIMLAIGGGLVLHLIPNRILMCISGIGCLVSVLLFALQPTQGPDGPSTSQLYWAWVFPAMCGSTIGIDLTYNITNIYISTSMPKRLQGAASGLMNSTLYLGMAFWLGIAELAISVTQEMQGDISLREQYRIAFWLGVGLAIVGLGLIVTVDMGSAEAAMTADEKTALERSEAAGHKAGDDKDKEEAENKDRLDEDHV